MTRPSDPLLTWLRKHLADRGWNTARLAQAAGIDRARARKILAGTEPMWVDELLGITRALELSPQDLEGVDLPDPSSAPAVTPLRMAAEGEAVSVNTVNPWGNQPEQLVRIAFAMGCDFFLLIDSAQLAGSGVPDAVLAQYRSRDLPIKLDAAYHPYNQPRYSPADLTLTLSFDALYDCRIPWSAFKQVIFFPLPPDPELPATGEDEAPPAPGVPHLRLVT